MSVFIRPFEASDFRAIEDCIVELQEAERSLDPRLRPGEEIAQGYFAELQARCAAQAGTVLVAEIAGEVCGFAAIQASVPFAALDDPIGDYALISDLVVMPAHRRRGVASSLLNAAEEFARSHGARELRIGVLTANAPAIQLYRELGFQSHFETLTKQL